MSLQSAFTLPKKKKKSWETIYWETIYQGQQSEIKARFLDHLRHLAVLLPTHAAAASSTMSV